MPPPYPPLEKNQSNGYPPVAVLLLTFTLPGWDIIVGSLERLKVTV